MPDTSDTSPVQLPDFRSAAARRHRKLRHFKDVLTRYLMATGGIGVIVAIVLIAFYLLYVVLPMFRPAGLEQEASYPVPGSAAATAHYAMDEYHEIGLRATWQGEIGFFRTGSGELLGEHALFDGITEEITAFAAGDPTQALLAFGTDGGRVLLVRHEYKVSYPEGTERLITPALSYPLGEAPVDISRNGAPVRLVSAQSADDRPTGAHP